MQRQIKTSKAIGGLLLLLLIASPFYLMAEPHFTLMPVKGVVSDASGNPLAGVTVQVKGDNSKSAVSNIKGEFSIDAEKGATLVFSYVGFQSKEITVTDDPVMQVSLTASPANLQEVVVTALGIKKEKAKVAYATQEVKGTALDKAPESNVAANLVGKVAGLDIRTKTNLFENPEILLRGEKTLIVIDGIPTDKETFDLWSLNANDIDNVSVLKGTAAAALYGALGINGAIMITTKKGKNGVNGVEITVNSSNQFQAGFIKIPKTQDQYGMGWSGFYAFIDGKSGGGWYDDYGYVWGPKLNVKNPANPSGFEEYPQYNSPYDPNQLYSFTQAGYTDVSHYKPLPWITRGKNNLKNFLNNELITTNNVTVAGKTDKSDYRISFTHLYQKGQVPNTKLNSTTLSVAGGLKLTDKFKVESSLSYNRQYTPNYPQTGYGANNFFYNILLWMGPDVDIRDLKNYWQPAGGRTGGSGNFIPYGVKDVQQFNYNYTWYNNPYYIANEALNGYTNDVINGQVNATYDFSKSLSLFARSGIITNNSLSAVKTPWSYVYYGSGLLSGQYQETRKKNLQIVSDVLLTYKKDFLNDFHATVSAGASNRYNDNSYVDAATVGLNVPALYTLSNSIAPVTSVNKLAQRMVNSAFGYADVDYKRMIFLGLTGRNDWTTVLQKPNNSYFYPSASLGVIPSSMVKMPNFISYVKLRGSWSKVSSDAINIYGNLFQDWYGTLPTYQTGPRWNGTNSSLIVPATLVTNGLKPNITVSRELGTELRFLKNRLGVDFTYFNYLQKNYIINAPVSFASGFNNVVVNGDEINRKGVEFVLTSTPVKSRTIKWDVIANISTAHSYVKSYYGGDSIRNAIKVGERTDVFRDWTWERSPDGQIVHASNGMPQYIDHVVNLGHTDPDYIYAVNNNITYKNFSLGFQFDGRVGGLMFNAVEAKLYEGGTHPATANSYRDDAYLGNKTYTGQGVVVTSGSVTYDIQGNITSDSRKFSPNTQKVNYIDYIFATYVNGIGGADIYKRSFVKLREVNLSYNVVPKILAKTPFKSASISVTGRNLWLSTKVPFMDPDGNTGFALAEPTYRNIGVNINLKF
jgi:TonB-linked SusC/RagA family outer membrane protein